MRRYLHQRFTELEQIRDALLASLHFPLLYPRGELGWHLAVQYQGVAISHDNNRVSRRNFAAYRLCIKFNGYSFRHRAARLFLSVASKLVTEMRVPSLSLSPGPSKLVLLLLTVLYSHKYSRNLTTRANVFIYG
jgi:hypothetical protein